MLPIVLRTLFITILLRDENVGQMISALYGKLRKVNPKSNWLPDEVQRYDCR